MSSALRDSVLTDPLTRKQPWRTLYLLYQVITTIFLRLPLWVVYYALPSNRPKSTWTLKRAVMIRAVKLLMHVAYMAAPLGHTPSYLAVEDGPDVKAVWIPPSSRLVVGKIKEWATAAGLESIKIPGYWIHKAGDDRTPGAPAKRGEKVLLAFHGGAYVRRSGHPTDTTANVAKGILEATPSLSRVLSVEYRLTRLLPGPTPANPFPAALLDAISSFNYLVNELGFEPANVVVDGDSAGANLALALVRYIVEHQSFPDVAMPAPPGALVLCSPWADLSVLGHDPGGSIHTNIPTDYVNVTTPIMEHIIAAFTGPLGPPAAETNRYISPASVSPMLDKVSYKNFPKTFILNGGSEVLRDQIRVLYERMAAEMGQDAVYLEMPDAVHDFLVFLWHEPERSEALEAIASFLQSE
ncbi:hypothetical protein EIP86_001432 [Pleurotus ostreatoroseus]|nr:hypothetical protein EIP86_001432 [Pleurotus ostreatoroseus]